jgi:membrane protein
MSIKDLKLEKIAKRIRHYHERNTLRDRILKKIWMLYHEVVRDDVTIRAESLSYFTLFSIMPILAGLFLVVSAFSQWAPVQEDFQSLIQNILAPLPEEHRKNLLQFIFDFKDVYLAKLSKTGSSLGIFAVMVLLFIIGKVFLNLEDLMNRIWSVKESRPWSERLRNLVLAMVIMPLSIFVALSLPGVINHFVGVKLGLLVEGGVPAILLLGFLYFLFRFFPNERIAHRNALFGALLSGVLFFFSNIFLNFYFRFGTQTAYGKAAVVPIAAFFIYVSWIIIMIGAEWSFVLQNEGSYTEERLGQPNLQIAAVLIAVFESCRDQHDQGTSPLSEADLRKALGVSPREMQLVLDFLIRKGILIRSEKEAENSPVFVYSFCHDPARTDLVKIVKEFLDLHHHHQNLDVHQVIRMISTK